MGKNKRKTAQIEEKSIFFKNSLEFIFLNQIFLLPLHPTKLIGYEEVQAKNSRQDAPEKTFGSWSCSD